MARKVSFYTLGCRVNQYESQLVAERFKALGWEIAGEEEAADAYVVNTCSVTALSDRKSRQYIRRMKRLNPSAVIAVMGCYPQTDPGAVEKLSEADIVIGTEGKERVPALVEELIRERELSGSCSRMMLTSGGRPSSAVYEDHASIVGSESRTRALLKIEEGCDRFCSYCVIPYARGPVRSRPLGSILDEAAGLVEAGYREIVLTGINTALYGTDRPDVRVSGIAEVVDAISAIPGDFRIRIGSLEPTVVNAEYVKELFGFGKLCHHLHLSIQSGSARVLEAMNRHYSPDDYLRIVRELKAFDPLYGITTDIITGFPGETEEDFQDSLDMVRMAEYLKVHGFPYSQRPFTAAAGFDGQIAPQEKKRRNARLAEVSEQVSLAFRSRMKGSLQRVLTEERARIGGQLFMKGHASNYCPVYIPDPGGRLEANRFMDVTAGDPVEDGVQGTPAETP
ncbi:MAG: tRNA (N(6)-L-threonylcarbamoyladenosine(37)-C(2))-methylthiotransferase MtaB [Firmicutes bacterium]|nr:tRNA (N(6)-L-threonylcarbamoyladenosine(37)-C(2))-methylthiotransferase MtaB [Bacillota bacterium]